MLRAVGRFFDTMLHRPVAGEQERRLVERLNSGHGDALAHSVLAGLDATAPSEPVLARIAGALCERADDSVRVGLWQQVAARYPGHAYILACLGDALLDAGRGAEAMEVLLDAFERAPLLIYDFDAEDQARHAGGQVWLRYQLAELAAAMVTAEQAHGDASDPDDDPDIDVRERYSELLEEYDGDAAAMAAIREIGSRITALENAGVLPQSLVRRGTWREQG